MNDSAQATAARSGITETIRTRTSTLPWVAALFVGLSLIHMWLYLPSGRLWAEEGAVILPIADDLGWFDVLTYVFHGHIELATNLLMLAATRVPFSLAPLVTTLGSFAVQLLGIGLIAARREQFGLSNTWLCLLLVSAVAIPQANEVYANSTNLHFHFALIAFAIVILPVGATRLGRWGTRFVLLFCGLSSISATFLIPILALPYWRERNRERLVQLLVLCCAAAVQAYLLLTHAQFTQTRKVMLDGLDIAAALVAQMTIDPWSALFRVDGLIAHLAHAASGDPIGIALLFLGLGVFASLLYLAWRRSDQTALRILAAAFAIAIPSTILALTSRKGELIATTFGGRYYYVPCLILLVGIGRLLSKTRPSGGRRSWAPVLPGALAVALAAHIRPDAGGPDWTASLARARATNSPLVEIWPFGMRMPNLAHADERWGSEPPVRLIVLTPAALSNLKQQSLPFLDTSVVVDVTDRNLNLRATLPYTHDRKRELFVVAPSTPAGSSIAPTGDAEQYWVHLTFQSEQEARTAAQALCVVTNLRPKEYAIIRFPKAHCRNILHAG